MSAFLRRSLVVAAIAAIFASGCGTSTETTSGPASDATAWPHDFSSPLVGGGAIDVGDYAGQDLVLWFWAPW